MEIVLIIFCCILVVSFITGLIITICNLLHKEKTPEIIEEEKTIEKPVIKNQPTEVLSFEYTTVYDGPLIKEDVI